MSDHLTASQTTPSAPSPRRIGPDDPAVADVLALIRSGFAYMEGRIDPPSSMQRLDMDAMRRQAENAEIWAIGVPVRAAVFLTPKADHLYLGKLVVSEDARGKGLARQLCSVAVERAKVLGLPHIILQSRVELAENHAAFAALGFIKTDETAHEGYDRPTSYTFTKDV